jgi:tetrahydromethanopterin S-methyltransferase subunit G
MELDELKSAWNKMSSENEKKLQLNEGEIQNLLGNRTRDITEKIGRNIRIGMFIVLGWVCLWLTIDFIFTPIFNKYLDGDDISKGLMDWSFILEVFVYVLIIATIIIFWIRYNRIEKQNIYSTDLKSKLSLHIKILDSYKTMFYIVLIIILFYITIAFSGGFIAKLTSPTDELQFNIATIPFIKWVIMAVVFLFTLGIFIAIYYFLFNFFFNRLYGRYLKQLKLTLKELDEVNSAH